MKETPDENYTDEEIDARDIALSLKPGYHWVNRITVPGERMIIRTLEYRPDLDDKSKLVRAISMKNADHPKN